MIFQKFIISFITLLLFLSYSCTNEENTLEKNRALSSMDTLITQALSKDSTEETYEVPKDSVTTPNEIKLTQDYILDKKMSAYLNDSMINKSAKEAYLLNFSPTDDSTTFYLLNLACKDSSYFNPFYFHIMTYILSKSDGALAEAVGSFCLKYLRNHPKEFFHYVSLSKNSDYIFQCFGDAIGSEFYFAEQPFEEATNFIYEIENVCPKCNPYKLHELSIIIHDFLEDNLEAQ